MRRTSISRRRFLAVAAAGCAGLAAGAACAPIGQPAPTAQPAPQATTAPAAPAAAQPTAAAAPAPTAVPAATAAPAAVTKGGRLTYGHLGGVLNFDGHRLTTPNWPIFNLLYNGLIRLDKDMKPQPELAESWQLSDDGLTMTLKLRKGVKFHNGREFVSEDVKLNLERIKDPKTASHPGPLAEVVEKIELPDKYTVVLKLSRITPNIFDLFDLSYMVAPESVPDLAKKGIGTGPFKLQEFTPGVQSLFVRNADYYKPGLPLLDEVLVKVIGEPSGLTIALESGAVDVVERFLPQEAPRLKTAPGIQVFSVWGGTVADVIINTRKKPFDNKDLRQAFSLSLNRQRIVDVALAGAGEAWCLPFPKNSIAYHADVASGGCKYDLAAAKQALEKAGLASGLEFELLVSTTTWSDTVPRAQIWQSDLAQIGVKARIVDAEAADYRERTWGDKYEVAMHSFGRANKDPDTLFRGARSWYIKNNFSGFESEEYTRLVNSAGSTVDTEKRRAIYKELSKYILDQMFCLTISPYYYFWGARSRVQGLTFHSEGTPIYENVSLA